ncbi:hypothetical protein PCO31110_01601 [Pandoraea communis]|uniref:DUF4054 domain-containing protein n=1 Tax=Pandoraea communis TaxID=2508297 RepID=A0A5E4TTX8_9BURK|nr:DUF4054 domain-containing protein [Pandoraea communis]VVD90633.1 hypothetical protein PCO31110_01601 [Pandoraea communis]
MASGVVEFNYTEWLAMFPTFSSVSESLATSYFGMAELFLNNTDASPVCNVDVRKTMLYLITAHIAFLMGRAMAGDGSGAAIVGQMTNATEGTVTAGIAASNSQNAAYWNQSQYGAMYWQMILPWRSFQMYPYVPVCRH